MFWSSDSNGEKCPSVSILHDSTQNSTQNKPILEPKSDLNGEKGHTVPLSDSKIEAPKSNLGLGLSLAKFEFEFDKCNIVKGGDGPLETLKNDKECDKGAENVVGHEDESLESDKIPMAETDYKTVVQRHLREVSATRCKTVTTVQVSKTIDNKYFSGLNVVSGQVVSGNEGIQTLSSLVNVSSNVASNSSNKDLKNVIGPCENKSDSKLIVSSGNCGQLKPYTVNKDLMSRRNDASNSKD